MYLPTFAPFSILQLYVWWIAPSLRLLLGPEHKIRTEILFQTSFQLYLQKASGPMADFEWQDPLKMWPIENINMNIKLQKNNILIHLHSYVIPHRNVNIKRKRIRIYKDPTNLTVSSWIQIKTTRNPEEIQSFLTCGLITEQKPKSVPKNGRKLVVFWGNLSEPNLIL